MYLAQVSRYDILYAVNQLARGMSKPLKAHMGAAKHLLRYLAGSGDLLINYKQGEFKLAAFSDANWGNNPDNARSTPSYIDRRHVPFFLSCRRRHNVRVLDGETECPLLVCQLSRSSESTHFLNLRRHVALFNSTQSPGWLLSSERHVPPIYL